MKCSQSEYVPYNDGIYIFELNTTPTSSNHWHSTIRRSILAICGIVTLIFVLGIWNIARAEESAKLLPPVSNDTQFALLVGIDDYAQPQDSRYRINPLKGPGNDVTLIKDLLISQFKFKDDQAHIVTITGRDATHAAIIDNFRNQLIENARKNPGATVVFYFSGHGSQAYDTQNITGTGFHQTLVAYDSRREGGSDIIDDEFNNQLEELRKYTDRITLIFDSCHSGGVWKDVTSMTAKNLPPNPFSSSTIPAQLATKDVGNTIRPGGGNYSVIVAAMANETAVEDQVPTKEGLRVHGLLTFYLDKIVRSNNDLTYDQIARKTASVIGARISSQHPEAEGDINRFFLGHYGDRLEPYIHVVRIDARKLTLDAGKADGLQPGALLAVYDRDTANLSGDAGKIATARVTELADFTAIAELPALPQHPVTTDSKIKVITPFAPDKGITVFLPSLSDTSDQTKSAADFLNRLRKHITDSPLLSIANGPQDAKIVVRWECRDSAEAANAADANTLAQPANRNCVSGYKFELVPSSQRYIIFDYGVASNEDPQKLADAIEKRARQESIRNLTNNATSLRGTTPGIVPLSIELEKLDVTINNGVPTVTSNGFSRDGLTPIKIGEYFRFKITNNSDKSLYVAVVYLASGGGIGLYSPLNYGELVLPGKSLVTVPPLRAGPPQGLESYKVLATTKPGMNFRILEQPGVTKDAVSSPLEWLLSQTGNTTMRDPFPATDLDLGDWTTAQHDIFIQK